MTDNVITSGTECAIIETVLGLSEVDARRRVSMRWTLLTFIQEFARHAGHGDILREQIDHRLP